MRTYTPLTQEEQAFAEKNHNILIGYLNKNGLDVDEWYDVIVFRYLLSVKIWFSKPELHSKCKFSTIAWRNMWSAVCNERAKQKRRIQTVSLDEVIPGSDNLTLLDTVTQENLNYLYGGTEEMKISYNLREIPERSSSNYFKKSDESLAIDTFSGSSMRNMCFEYDTEAEAKKKIGAIGSYIRVKKLGNLTEHYRVGRNIYIVRKEK